MSSEGSSGWRGTSRAELGRVLLSLALFSLAFGPRFLLVDRVSPSALSWMESLQASCIGGALVVCGLVRGWRVRPRPWPAVVTLGLLMTSLIVFVSRGVMPARGLADVLHATLAFSLPWCFTLVRFGPPDRARLRWVLMGIPALSVLGGLLLQGLGYWSIFIGRLGGVVRLQGATRADYLAAFALAAVAVALHEWVTSHRRRFAVAAGTNLVILVFTGGRMGMLATVVWIGVYLLRSPAFRELLRQRVLTLLVSGAVLVGAVLLYLPTLRYRWSGWSQLRLDLSGREEIWRAYFELFGEHPWLGHGLGSTQPGVYLEVLPHQEYLRLLVEGGVVGLLLFGAAVFVWSRELRGLLELEERPVLAATLAAMLVYALTDNPLSSFYLGPFVYLGLLLRPGTPPCGASSR